MQKSRWIPSLQPSRRLGWVIALIGWLAPTFQAPASPPAAASQPDENPITKAALASFVREYSLAEGQALKRVGKPYPAARQAYYEIKHARQAKAITQGPDYFTFTWGDTERTDPLLGQLRLGRMGWVNQDGMPLREVLAATTGLPLAQLLGNPADLNRVAPGDWVYRHGAKPEATIAELQTILREELNLPVRVAFERRKIPVLIAEGDYQHTLLPGHESWSSFYDEQTVSTFDKILAVDMPIEKLPTNMRKLQDYTGFKHLLEYLSRYTQLTIIDRVGKKPRDNDVLLTFRYSVRRYRAAMDNRDADADYLLNSVTQQTGIRFTKVEQEMPVVVVQPDTTPPTR